MTTATYDDHEERIRNVEISVATIQAVIPTLATKEDVQAIRTDMEALRGEARADNEALRGEAKADNEALRADLYRLETRLIKWMVGSVIAATIAAGSIAGVVTAIIIRFVA